MALQILIYPAPVQTFTKTFDFLIGGKGGGGGGGGEQFDEIICKLCKIPYPAETI